MPTTSKTFIGCEQIAPASLEHLDLRVHLTLQSQERVVAAVVGRQQQARRARLVQSGDGGVQVPVVDASVGEISRGEDPLQG